MPSASSAISSFVQVASDTSAFSSKTANEAKSATGISGLMRWRWSKLMATFLAVVKRNALQNRMGWVAWALITRK